MSQSVTRTITERRPDHGALVISAIAVFRADVASDGGGTWAGRVIDA
jgi:hypothetical protein